jgi:Na+/proline symporter
MFTSIESVLLLAGFVTLFGGLAYLVSWLITKNIDVSKAQFLLANRKLGFWESSFSISATWIWAPALFVSAFQAYTNGWIGLFWFLVPNIFCLLLFSIFANKIKTEFPQGYTLSEFMGQRHSGRVQKVYWVTLIGLTVCAFAVQLLAGGKLVANLTGLPYFAATVILALIPLTYSIAFGLKASVITDFVKMAMILGIGIILIPMAISAGGGFDTVVAGLGGKKENLDFFSEKSWLLFLTFGLPTTIGLISGPFGDQSFWQRAFATRDDVVKRSFVTAAFLFGIVPLCMGLLGFLAVGSGITIKDPQMVNMETVLNFLGLGGVVVLFMLVMSALTSIIDSKLCSVSSIVGHDVAEKYNLGFLNSAKMSMVLLTVIAIAIANIPDLKILHLFLFYGTLRSATLVTTVLTLLNKKLNESGVFYGILVSILVGLPIFAYGNFNANPTWIVVGSLVTVLTPLVSLIRGKSSL